MSKKKLKKIAIINKFIDLTSAEKSIANRILSSKDDYSFKLGELIAIFGAQKTVKILEKLQSKIEKAKNVMEKSNEENGE